MTSTASSPLSYAVSTFIALFAVASAVMATQAITAGVFDEHLFGSRGFEIGTGGAQVKGDEPPEGSTVSSITLTFDQLPIAEQVTLAWVTAAGSAAQTLALVMWALAALKKRRDFFSRTNTRLLKMSAVSCLVFLILSAPVSVYLNDKIAAQLGFDSWADAGYGLFGFDEGWVNFSGLAVPMAALLAYAVRQGRKSFDLEESELDSD